MEGLFFIKKISGLNSSDNAPLDISYFSEFKAVVTAQMLSNSLRNDTLLQVAAFIFKAVI